MWRFGGPRPAGCAQAHTRLGLALFGLGRDEEALDIYDTAASLDPGRSVTHLARALPLARLGRDEEAPASCGTAAEPDPALPGAHLSNGVLAGVGRGAGALAAYDAAVELGPQRAEAHSRRAALLRTLGLRDEALRCCGSAIEPDPGHAESLTGKGGIPARLGWDEEADGCYKAAQRLGRAVRWGRGHALHADPHARQKAL